MPRKKQTVIEFRNYELSPHFPILLLSGEHWKISDVPSGKLHIHNCLEIGLCLSDSGFMELEGSRRPFKEGDITIISSSVPHTTYSSPGCASQWAYLFADPGELLHPFFSGTDSENPRILSAAEGHLSMILEKEKYSRLYLLVRELIQEMEGAKEYKELAVRGLFLAVLTQLARIRNLGAYDGMAMPSETVLEPASSSKTASKLDASSKAASSAPAPEPMETVITPALEYIRRHYSEDISMDALAQMCGLSPTHFRRRFSAALGISPLKYLILMRIKKAASLLRLTAEPILSISEQTGFHSISSFNRHFFAIMGESPRQWRNRASSVKNPAIVGHHGWMYAEEVKGR